MGHTIREKTKLINRSRKLRGQVEAVERALETEAECAEVMRLLAACRGAVNSLFAEVVEDHIREHLAAPGPRVGPRAEAANDLIDVVHSYFK
ncbi:MAG TPA: metal/formaldehyde-sensitive transcriptional repressor [Steroidobacteraceae bacterium]|nr:metal/formaldehyde-sensitive transcriptional repressor [Steroidobacteraceae bacterium]